MDEDNVIVFPGFTTLDIPVERPLKAALKEVDNIEDIFICGRMKDGAYFFASSTANGPEIVWMIERAKQVIMDGVDD